jgi:two-component system cell cycle response regulator CpdR
MELFLRDAGYAVATLDNGRAARAALESQSFDALLVDAVLPGMSGLELAEIAAARGVAVIVFSGELETIKKLDGHCAHVFLAKPFHLTALEAALREILPEKERALSDGNTV